MLWIVVLLMCCLRTVESYGCSKSEIIVGRLGKELVLNFTFSDIRDEFNNYIAERGIIEHDRRKIMIENEINIQDLKKESDIRFENKMDSTTEQIIFIDGNPTDRSADSRTEIFLANDAFVVKKTKLQLEDAGIYWIEFRSVRLGQKVLIITGKPTITGLSPPNPVLKAEDNYSTILQLECHSVSTSIGDCQLYNSMYIMWYKNGMRMTELDPTLSQINVTVDHNGGNFTCLATEYHPCYHRLQTTQHYADVLNIEECDNVYESETFIVKPQYAPIHVKLEPDQREITVNENDELTVRCSAKCHPKCDVKWEKDFQGLESSSLVTITERVIESELKIVNINSSDKGVYSCLVNNIHGEAEKNFTLIVRATEKKVLKTVAMYNVIVAVKVFVGIVIVVAVIVTVVVIPVIVTISVINYKDNQNRSSYLTMDLRQSAQVPDTSRLRIDRSNYLAMDLRQAAPPPETLRLITDGSSYLAMDPRQAAPPPVTSGLRIDRSNYLAMDLHQSETVPETSRVISDRSNYLAMDLPQAAPPPETSGLITDRSSYLAMDQGVPVPETSRFRRDRSHYEKVDSSCETLNGSYKAIDRSYETIDGSYETIDGSYETIDGSNRQSAAIPGTSRENTSRNDVQSKKPKHVKYDVLGVKAVPSVYTRLYQETPPIPKDMELVSDEDELS